MGSRVVKLTTLNGLVRPTSAESRDGCKHCSMLPQARDFETYRSKTKLKNPDRYKVTDPEPYYVKNRAISEGKDTKVDVLFVLDYPDHTDDRNGTVFRGAGGAMLRKAVRKHYKKHRIRYGFAYITRCAPARMGDPSKVAVRCCSPELKREIALRKPKVVVPLGNSSLEFFMGRRGITHLQGRGMMANTPGLEQLIVVPCFNPIYVLKNTWELDNFWKTLVLAGDYAKGKQKIEDTKAVVEVVDTLSKLRAAVAELHAAKGFVAFDTETGSLSPFDTRFPQLLCISFSARKGHSYVVPLDHAESPWTLSVPRPRLWDVEPLSGKPKPPEDTKTPGRKIKQAFYEQWVREDRQYRKAVLKDRLSKWIKQKKRAEEERPEAVELLRGVFLNKNIRFVGQHEKFDRKHIRRGLGVRIKQSIFDTLTTHYALDDRPGGHGLDILAVRYTSLGGYDRPLADYIAKHKECKPREGGSYANIPGDILFPYAGLDADVTRRCMYAMLQEKVLKDKAAPLFQLSQKFFPLVSETLSDMEYVGAPVDLKVAGALRKEEQRKLDLVIEAIRKSSIIQRFEADKLRAMKDGSDFEFNPGSDMQVGEVLWEYCGLSPIELTDGGYETLVARFKVRVKKQSDLTFDDLKLEAIENKEWDRFSTKEDVLNQYKQDGNPIAGLILDYRKHTKLISTYFDPIIEQAIDSVIRGSFNQTGARTGRLSSSGPNLQNLEPTARKAYVSRFKNGVLIQADYSQIELRVACCLFDEPLMIAAYLNNEDLHRVTAIALYGKGQQAYDRLPAQEQKEWRRRAKYINFGIIYGVGPSALIAALKKDGVFIEFEEATGMLDKFRNHYRSMFRNMDKLKAKAAKELCVRTFTGRTRHLPELSCDDEEIRSIANRQAINTVVQGGAAELTLMSLVLINQWLRANKLRAKLFATVHDSIVVDAPFDEAPRVAKQMKYIMENIATLAKEMVPCADWSWVKVPIVAEIEMGRTWYHAVPFDPETYDDGEDRDEPLYKIDEKGGYIFRAPADERELLKALRLKHVGKKAA